jgi:protein sidekick
MEDSGMFQCLAANEAGEDSVYTWLKVKSKPLIIHQFL